ncbi:MAG: ubiquitin-like domain-containing protein [Anaerolineaceae bacterium]|nr:ubiquitin-like domain-containing protein [Anaerolineaceae bacterium]
MAKYSKPLMGLALFLLIAGSVLLASFVRAHASAPESGSVSVNPLPKPAYTRVPGKKITLQIGDQAWELYSQADTLAEFLKQAGVQLHPKDKTSLALSSPVSDGLKLRIFKARQIWVESPAANLSGLSAAQSVGKALQDLGMSLQGLDYAEPAEEESVPADGKIKVHKVSEQIALIKEETPAGFRYQEDPETELDTQKTLTPAIPGYVVTRSRARVIDGEVQNAEPEGPWKASDPQDGVIGRGSKVVITSEVVDGVELHYWRKLSVYATGYKPSSNGGTGTASGIPLTKGIIAVELSWYNSGMAFQKVYVPGYGFGTIADTGPNILGHPWIDLGFDDDNYVSWHHWTTLYLLEPVPAAIPLVMP